MFRVIGSIFKWIWKALSWTRVLVLNLIFLAFVIIIIASLRSSPALKIPNNSALVVTPFGALVDQKTYNPSVVDSIFSPSQTPQETLVRDITQAIRHAANDGKISGLILKLDYLQSGGMSKVEEIGQAINEFKVSGKPVIAYASTMDQQRYLLASYADELYLNEMGSLYLTGFGSYRNYYKNLADKLDVEFNIFRVGDYKDAIEPFMRADMSPESREHVSTWLNEAWQRYAGIIESHRDLEKGSLDTFINGYEEELIALKGNASELYLQSNLIDGAPTTMGLQSILTQKFGLEKNGKHLNAISMYEYLNNPTYKTEAQSSNKIGLIVASGAIVDGKQPEGVIGSETLSALIEKARDDKDLSALVVRVDSGGGSAFASEVIREQLLATKDAGLPVYISMGSVAASGGYWISAPATEIWATPSTLTGSIGVFGLIPNVSKSLENIGVTTDGVATSPLAGLMRVDKPMSDEAKNLIQSGVENIYWRFISLVSNAREQSPEKIHSIAQGRVWSGEAALQIGLVDKLGSLHDVFEAAAKDLSFDSYSIKEIKRPLSPQEQFLRTIMEQVEIGESEDHSMLAKLSSLVSLGSIGDDLNLLVNTGSGRNDHVYASCLVCIAP